MSTLRSASIADLGVIARLESELFAGEAWSSEMVADELTADYRAYIVLTNDDDEVIGYAGLFAPGSEGDVQTIAVHPDYQGKGYGRRLLAALLDEAALRGVKELFLEVRADNETAQQLYRSVGFEAIGERPNYYQPGNVAAVVMRLPMSMRKSDSSTEGVVRDE
jgi:ribosomal-protein-alanine acetyltransferase